MNEFKSVSIFPGVWVRSIPILEDNRGFFYEELRKEDLPGNVPEFVQDSISFSRKNVLRGMHMQIQQWQLVTLLEGEIIDVLVNLETTSNNYGESTSFNLCWDKLNQLLISPGIAHGFAVIGDSARIHYKSSVYFGSTEQFGVHWASAEIAHLWPDKDWLLSVRDSQLDSMRQFDINYTK